MIGGIDPFGPIAPMPTAQSVAPKKMRGGLSAGLVNAIQTALSKEGAQGGPPPPAPAKGTANAMSLKPGWGGGS